MKDLYKSFLSLFLTVGQSEVHWSYYLSCFQATPNSRAAYVQEILKLVKSDLCKYFASNTTSYMWIHQLTHIHIYIYTDLYLSIYISLYIFPMQCILLLCQDNYLYGGPSITQSILPVEHLMSKYNFSFLKGDFCTLCLVKRSLNRSSVLIIHLRELSKR